MQQEREEIRSTGDQIGLHIERTKRVPPRRPRDHICSAQFRLDVLPSSDFRLVVLRPDVLHLDVPLPFLGKLGLIFYVHGKQINILTIKFRKNFHDIKFFTQWYRDSHVLSSHHIFNDLPVELVLDQVISMRVVFPVPWGNIAPV